ncbi:MAG: nucleotide sugar dehydrogenase [Methanomassiliicoccales archaeon]|nr:MAG: nucleotide sugar dehydrogenase [Methanomassiliicoccales archaeon]
MKRVVVVGLGYVGIPVACGFANAGFEAVGIDVIQSKIDMINKGESPVKGKEPGLDELLKKVHRAGRLKATDDYSVCKGAYAILIMVETPVDKDNLPRYKALKSAVSSVGENLTKGTIVVIESTIAPRTTTDIVQPILEKNSGLKAGEDFYLAHCPERVAVGVLLKNLKELDRIIGGINEESAKKAKELYKKIVKGKLYLTDSLTAEVVKTAENTYRDTQIAFANELAYLCEELGIDAFEVQKLVNTSPGRQMLLPGAGVGGHCVPKDPWLLLHGSGETFKPKIIPTSREINDSMPHHMIDLAEEALTQSKVKSKGAKIAVMGYAFIEDSDDVRNTPALPIIEHFAKSGAEVIVHDPYVKGAEGIELTGNLNDALVGADCAIFVTGHSRYKSLKLKNLVQKMRTPIIIDGRNLFDRKKCIKEGFVYKGIGKRH